MNNNLKVLLLSLGMLVSSVGTISAVTAQTSTNQNLQKSFLNNQQQNWIEASAKQVRNRELNAFSNSKYDYWDARVLGDYWGQSAYEAKARIGRKILWGKSDVAVLEQFLVDARVNALQKLNNSSNNLPLYIDSKYRYNDAQKLAKLWGEKSPWDAKIRIEKNLILGQQEVIEQALKR
ncbi:hypothetical protein NIES267_30860 [Calothrix parasitica NIES-267]|uniref:Uncharacterized protein n=1 Tax=Calothrix parasitica NIES-267 TaxID=1973488 RepID=A0A1Z4LQW8_9CYAN|nr:hypothetical protein NIES267_30860 [Calothrix parasitica NIES-267]